eukprot:1731255-Prymnesium_polylepis.2
MPLQRFLLPQQPFALDTMVPVEPLFKLERELEGVRVVRANIEVVVVGPHLAGLRSCEDCVLAVRQLSREVRGAVLTR